MGSSVNKYFDIYEDWTDPVLNEEEVKTIKQLRDEYPEIEKMFLSIQLEQFILFSKKMLDYGKGNISLGGNMDNDEDILYSLTGIQIRLNDKINRLKNLLKNGKNHVKDESIEDTFADISNYGVIAQIISRKQWR